jgi:16S rRNA (guanine(966)-N(2))-methyltransferase RsmD
MRVIAGIARGRPLKGPRGRGLRPTSDLVRGAAFDILTAMGADFSRVLDLYAGTGALGIEALSRGGGWCDFVEKDERACRLIRQNLETTRLREKGAVHCWPVEKVLTRLEGQYSLVLADPPYGDEKAEAVLEELCRSPLVGSDAAVVMEHSHRRPPPPVLGSCPLVTSRRHGDTSISFYRSGGSP